MDDALLQELLGPGDSNGAIIQALRAKQARARLGALSGDKVIAPQAAQMNQEANAAIGDIGNTRLRKAAEAARKAENDRNFGLQEREFGANQAYRGAQLGLDRERLDIERGRLSNAVEVAKIRAAAVGKGKAGAMPIDYGHRADEATNIANVARSAVKDTKWNTTGALGGQILNKVGGTDARNLGAKLDTVKANLAFDRLQRMRDEAKTGGALGSIAVKELDFLMASVANLDQAQSEKQLDDNLNMIATRYDRLAGEWKKLQAAGIVQTGLPTEGEEPEGDGEDDIDAIMNQYLQ